MMNMSHRRSNTSLRAKPNKEYNPDSFDSDDSLFNDFLQDGATPHRFPSCSDLV